jgi:hypothetical protein
MGATGSLSRDLRAPELLVAALAVASLAAFAPPATAAGVGLTGLLVLLAARLELPRAFALAWGLAVVPVYMDLPTFTVPAQLAVAPILFTRIFLVERRPLSLPTALDWILLGIVLVAGIVSTAVSDQPVLSAYYFGRLVLTLLYIPAARAVYTDRDAIAPSLVVLLVALGLQIAVGLAQLTLGVQFAIDLLASPLTPAFIVRGAVEGKLARQDFNWIAFGLALPSGLFINSIVYAVCLATGGFILIGAPSRWLPHRRDRLCRAGGVLAVLVAFICFKLTAWLGILAGAVTLTLTRIRDPRTRWRALLIPPLVLVVLGFVFQDLIEQRLYDIARGSLFTRIFTWFTYLNNLQHRGMLGVGLGRASVLAPELPTMAGGQAATLELAPESSPIGLSAEIGVPGMVALYFLLIRLGLGGRRFHSKWAWPAMATVLVGNLAVYGLTDEHIMSLVALLVGLVASPGARDG